MNRYMYITCNIAEVRVPDLGLFLRRGESCWVPPSFLDRSLVLRQLLSVGSVSIDYKNRYVRQRPPVPAPPNRMRPPTPPADADRYASFGPPIPPPVHPPDDAAQDASPKMKRGRGRGRGRS